MPLSSLAVQLRIAIRTHLRQYMDQAVICDDASCQTKTRDISVFGRRCLALGCHGNVHFEVCIFIHVKSIFMYV